jgi:hypothetical protein
MAGQTIFRRQHAATHRDLHDCHHKQTYRFDSSRKILSTVQDQAATYPLVSQLSCTEISRGLAMKTQSMIRRRPIVACTRFARVQKQRDGTPRAIASDTDERVKDSAEEKRLMNTDAFAELVALNKRTQSVNRLQKARVFLPASLVADCSGKHPEDLTAALMHPHFVP